MIDNDVGERWMIVHRDPAAGDPTVRRYPVPSGWLYQVSHTCEENDWYPPVFVPLPATKEVP